MTLGPYRDRELLAPALSRNFKIRLENELDPGEELLWSAVPNRRRLWRRSLAIIPLALFWNAVFIYWIWNVVRASFPFSLFGAPFALFGLSLLSTPYRSWRDAQHTFYALTDRRAILFGASKVCSFTRQMLGSMSRTERPDGSGDLVFATEPDHSARQNRAIPVGFIGIHNPKEVERMIRNHLLR